MFRSLTSRIARRAPLGVMASSRRLLSTSAAATTTATTRRGGALVGLAAGAALLAASAFTDKDGQGRFAQLDAGSRSPKVISTLIDDPSKPAVVKDFKYVIVGAGVAAYGALKSIKDNEPNAQICIIANDSVLPPDRFSLELREDLRRTYTEWRRHVASNLPESYATKPTTLDLTILLGQSDMHVDPKAQEVLLADGSTVRYEKALIATQGSPRDFYMYKSTKNVKDDGSETVNSRINTLTTLGDFKELNDLIDAKSADGKSIAVVGGGFLGAEIAASLAGSNVTVEHVFAESSLLKRYLPEYLSEFTTKQLQGSGVNERPNNIVTKVHLQKQRSLDTGAKENYMSNKVLVDILGDVEDQINTDYVVLAATHVNPDIHMLKASGLELDKKNGGVVVNSQFEAIDGLYVAGDAASFYDPVLGRRRLERLDHAYSSGVVAGFNMSSPKNKAYSYQPSFTSKLESLGIQVDAVGIVDSNLTTVGVFLSNLAPGADTNVQYKKGLVYYLDQNCVVGVLLWNSPEHLEKARGILKEKSPVRELVNLKNTIQIGPDEYTNVLAEGGFSSSGAKVTPGKNLTRSRRVKA